MLKKQETEQAVKMEQRVASTRRKDRFFDFNMNDCSKLNFRKLEKIYFLRADLSDHRKID